MTYDLVLRCMMNPDLPFTLRASFCQLMQNLYVDVEPNKAVSLINYTRVSLKSQKKPVSIQILDEISVLILFCLLTQVWSDLNKKPMLNASTDAFCKSARSNFSELCTFISYYVADNNVQSVVDVAHNKLTLSVSISASVNMLHSLTTSQRFITPYFSPIYTGCSIVETYA